MTSFGRYETVRELHRGGFTVLYSGQTEADSEAKFAIKVFQPSTYLLETEQAKIESALFLNSAHVQQKTAAGGAQHWASIYECDSIPNGAFYVADKYDRSFQQLIDVRVKLGAEALREIVESVAKGLVELKQAFGRPHGNLKATNILITGEGDISQTTIALSDPLPDEHIDTTLHWDTDLRAIAELIYQLIMHRPTPAVGGWQIPDSKEWSKLGKSAKEWRNLCNRLLNAHMKPGTMTIETLIDELSRLKKIKPVLSFRRLVIAIGLIVIAGAATFIIKPDILEFILPPEPPSITEWNQLSKEYGDWVGTLRNDLGLPKGNQREKEWTNNPHLSIIVENIKKASYPYDVAYSNNVLEQDLNKIQNEEDLRKYRIKATRTTTALKAADIIKFFFDIKSDPNSFALYDPNSPTDRKEFKRWPALVETQQTVNKFKERGWQELAKSLEDLVEQVRPGLENKKIAENVDKILELRRNLDDIESRWAKTEENQEIFESTGDPILSKFLGHIQSKLVSANLDILGRELEQMGSLADKLAKFIEDNWQKVDKKTFLNEHGSDSEESLTDNTFTNRLVVIKGYLYLDPDPREELFELINRIEGNIPLARLSNPLEAERCSENLKNLRQDIKEIEEKPGIEKYRPDITDAVNTHKPKLIKLEERVIAATETPEKYHQRIRKQIVLSAEATEEINKNWLTSRDNLLEEYPLSALKENLGKYAELRRKMDDTIRNLEELNEELRTELPEQLDAEVKGSDWNNKLKQLYYQERKGAIIRIVENIPLQDEVPDINAPSFKQFSLTQFSKFQQFQVDMSGILAAFNEIEYGLNACYLLGQKLPESDQTVRLLWVKWKDTDILKEPRINNTLAKLTKRIKELEEIEQSDDRDTLGKTATDPSSQTEAMYAAWKRLGEITALPWPDTDKEWARDKEIQEALRAKLPTIKAQSRAIELRNTLDDVSLKREKIYREANIRRYKTIVKSKSSADPVLAKFETLEPYDADADLSEVMDFESLAKVLSEFVTDPNWPAKCRTDLFIEESPIYKKASLTKNDFQAWMEEVTDYYKLEDDPRNNYSWDERVGKIEGLIGKELVRKQDSVSLGKLQNLKSDFDNVKSTINNVLSLPAIEKHKVRIFESADYWVKLLEIERKLKPEYCNRIELENGRLIFSTSALQANFEPIDFKNKKPVALATGWEQIRQAVTVKQKEWLDFFYTIDGNDTQNTGWPQYARSTNDPNVTLRFIPADGDNPEPFYMATHEITNAQYRAFLNTNAARSRTNRPGWSWFTDQSNKELILSTSSDDPPCAIKWSDSNNTFVVAEEDANIPVTYVTHHGAQSYAKSLGSQLPTVSQHKYACKAGTNNIHPWGNNLSEISSYAHVRAGPWQNAAVEYNSKVGTLDEIPPPPVGAVRKTDFTPYEVKLELGPDKVVHNESSNNSAWPISGANKANRWGLYDMIGNVWEWCTDNGNAQSVICGGSCLAPPEYLVLESESNYKYSFSKIASDVGFRVIVPAK